MTQEHTQADTEQTQQHREQEAHMAMGRCRDSCIVKREGPTVCSSGFGHLQRPRPSTQFQTGRRRPARSVGGERDTAGRSEMRRGSASSFNIRAALRRFEQA